MTRRMPAAAALVVWAACTPAPAPAPDAAANRVVRPLSAEEGRRLTMLLLDLHEHRLRELADQEGVEQKSLEVVVETGEDGAVRRVGVEEGRGLERFAARLRGLLEGTCAGDCPPLGRGKVRFSLVADGPRPPYLFVAVSPDGTALARVTGPPVNRLEVFEAASGRQRLSRKLPDAGFVAGVALTNGPGAKAFVLGSVRLIVEVDDPDKAPLSLPGESFFGQQDVAVGAEGEAVLVAQMPHAFLRGPGSTLAAQRGAIVGLADGVARPVPGDVKRVEGAALSVGQRWLAEVGARLRVWDLAEGRDVFPEKAPAVEQAFFSADGTTLWAVVSAGEAKGRSLVRYKARTWARQDSRPLPTRKEARLASVSRDGALAFYAPGGDDEQGSAEVVEVATGKRAYQFETKAGRADVVLVPGGAFARGLSGYQGDVAVHSLVEKRMLWVLASPPPPPRAPPREK